MQGKIWAATDPSWRHSKRLKDELDIARFAGSRARTKTPGSSGDLAANLLSIPSKPEKLTLTFYLKKRILHLEWLPGRKQTA